MDNKSNSDEMKSRFDEVNRAVKQSCLLAGFDEKETAMIKLIVWEAVGLYNSYRD